MASKEELPNAMNAWNISDVATDISERFPHLGVTISDLAVPSSEFVTTVCKEYWCHTFCGIIPEHLSDHDMSNVLYPEVYQHILPISNLHSAISIILKANGFHGFTVSDITHPLPKRTLTVLALIENFAKFYVMKNNDLMPLYESIKNRNENYQSMCAQNEQLRQELNNRANNKIKREIDTKEQLAEQSQKKIKVENLLKQQKMLADNQNRIQSKLYINKQKCESLTQQCQNVDQENADLNKLVVLNPDVLTNKLAVLKQQLCLKQEELIQKNEVLKLKTINMDQFSTIVKTQKYQTKMLTDINSLTTYLQSKSNYIQDKEIEQKTVQEGIQRDQDKVAMKLESINKLQDQNVRLKLQEDAKATQRKKSMDLLNKEYLDMKANHDDLVQRYNALEKLQNKSYEMLAQMQKSKVIASQHIEKKYASIVAEQEEFDRALEQLTLAAINRQQLIVSRSNID